jgi:hypothetical protein
MGSSSKKKGLYLVRNILLPKMSVSIFKNMDIVYLDDKSRINMSLKTKVSGFGCQVSENKFGNCEFRN